MPEFTEQPLTIDYLHLGKQLHYTPDFQLACRQRTRLVECKPEKRVEDEDNQRKFQAARNWCGQNGWEFAIATDTAIRAGFRLANVKLLRRYASLSIAPQVVGQICACLYEAQTPLSLVQVGARLMPEKPVGLYSTLLHMAFHHKVYLPVDAAPISTQSSITLPTGGLA